MPSQRRIKVFGLVIVIAVVTILFYTASHRQNSMRSSLTANEFYEKTVKGLKHAHPEKAKAEPVAGSVADSKPKAEAGSGQETDLDDKAIKEKMQDRLNEAAAKAKSNANIKAPKPDPPSAVVGVGSSEKGASGRKKTNSDGAQEPLKEESKEEHDLEEELNSILKKSPVIIFSKSYCPHSKRAKGILLEKYTIDPAPYVVELDLHPLGAALQARLAELTGRRTVPNTLVNAVSIGGGDDVAELDAQGTLISKFKDIGGSKILDIKLKESAKKESVKGLRR